MQGARGPGQVDLVMGLQVIGTTWKCLLCGRLDRYMTRFTNWKAIEKEFILQHVVKTPSDDSCICMLEAKRHYHTPDYIPKWKEKLTVTPRLMQKCIHPQCTDTDKMIHVSFDETDNLEAALGVTITPCYVHVCVYICTYFSHTHQQNFGTLLFWNTYDQDTSQEVLPIYVAISYNIVRTCPTYPVVTRSQKLRLLVSVVRERLTSNLYKTTQSHLSLIKLLQHLLQPLLRSSAQKRSRKSPVQHKQALSASCMHNLGHSAISSTTPTSAVTKNISGLLRLRRDWSVGEP